MPEKIRKLRTLVELLRQRAEASADQGYSFLLDGVTVSESLSFRDLDVEARRIAAMLQAEGVKRGSPVLLMFVPGLDFIRALFGCLYAGAIAVPVEPPMLQRLERTVPRIRAVLRDCRPSWILTSSEFRNVAPEMSAVAPEISQAQWLVVETRFSMAPDSWAAPRLSSTDLAILQYTSGSTRAPRGVMLSHGNVLHNQELIRTGFRLREGDVVGVSWLPVYHDMGLIGMLMQPLYLGGRSVMMPPIEFLASPYKWLAAISNFGGTLSGAPNFAYELCARKVSESEQSILNLASWEVAFCGAEPVRATTLDRFAARFGPSGFRRAAFLPCYGLAEATLIVSGALREQGPVIANVDRAELQRGRVVHSTGKKSQELVGCGPVIGDQEILIVDDRAQRLSGVGEIWIRGKSVGRGYWGNPEDTKEIFGAELADGSGAFLRSGDLGFLENGELFIVGRVKDLIIVRGVNYYPHDIEATAEISWPGLRPGCSAAFSIEGAGTEDAVIVCEYDGREARPGVQWKTLVDAVRGDVAQEYGLALRRVVIVSRGQVPKTPSGKVQRSLARSQYLEGALTILHEWKMAEAEVDSPSADLVLLETPPEITGFIVSWLSERLQAPVTPDVHFLELGLDSLDVVKLMEELSARLGSPIHPGLPLDYPTASELGARLAEGRRLRRRP